MDFALTQEQQLIQESAYKFGQQVILPGLAERDRAHESDPTMLKKLAESGFLGVCMPEKYSGMGADYISLGIVCEEMERRQHSSGRAQRPRWSA